MHFALPIVSRAVFDSTLSALSPEPLNAVSLDAMYAHYQELSRWNQRLALIGPGTVDQVLSRHFGESLAALPLLRQDAQTVVDVGSGAGFPGVVLAAARPIPPLDVTLVESREKKWSFLLAAVRKASLPCRCLNVRVGVPLPAGLPETIDVVTARALKLEPDVLQAFAGRLRPEGRILLWVGENDPDLPPELAPGRSVKIEGSERRRILELRLSTSPGL
jgi:16S rRNA (guanine527-N7)-methyltransferase